MSGVKKICELPGCGAEFTDNTSNHNAKYCSYKCQGLALRARKKEKRLNGVVSSTSPPASNLLAPHQPSVQLDPLGAFIKEQLEDKISELKKALEKKEGDLEALRAKKEELEKRIIELEKAIDAKPSGLSGFMESNQGMIQTLAEHAGPGLGEGLGELFKSFAQKVKGQQSQHAKVIDDWMITLPVHTQNDVLNMLQGLINLGPQKMPEKISEIARSLMEATKEQQEIVDPLKKRIGTGIGL